MESITLVIVIGALAAFKTALRCVEILVQAHADNLRERSRRETAMSVLTGIHGIDSASVPPGCESIALEQKPLA